MLRRLLLVLVVGITLSIVTGCTARNEELVRSTFNNDFMEILLQDKDRKSDDVIKTELYNYYKDFGVTKEDIQIEDYDANTKKISIGTDFVYLDYNYLKTHEIKLRILAKEALIEADTLKESKGFLLRDKIVPYLHSLNHVLLVVDISYDEKDNSVSIEFGDEKLKIDLNKNEGDD